MSSLHCPVGSSADPIAAITCGIELGRLNKKYESEMSLRGKSESGKPDFQVALLPRFRSKRIK